MFTTHEKLGERTGKNKPDRREYLKMLVEEFKTTPTLGMKITHLECPCNNVKIVLYHDKLLEILNVNASVFVCK